MDTPADFCHIDRYVLNEAKTKENGLTQIKKNCANYPLCQTTRMDTSYEKIYIFSYDIYSNARPAYYWHRTEDFNVSITCGGEIQSISENSISYVFPRNMSNTGA